MNSEPATAFNQAALIEAERQLRALYVVAECLDLAPYARVRIEDSLGSIERALAAVRPVVMMEAAVA